MLKLELKFLAEKAYNKLKSWLQPCFNQVSLVKICLFYQTRICSF